MKLIKVILLFFIGILIIPIFSLIVLSFQDTNGVLFHWYFEVFRNNAFISAFSTSIITSIFVGLATIIIGFTLSLSYFSLKTRLLTIFFILIMGLIPSDIVSISINKFAQVLGFYRSNSFFLYFGLVTYCLPFTIIILWTRYYYMEKTLFAVSNDLGLNTNSIIFRILIPLSKSAIISAFLFSFLLSFNEYPRTFYLSGSTVYLSEYLNGKLSSGTNNSIYAGGSVSIFVTCIVIVIYGLALKIKSTWKDR